MELSKEEFVDWVSSPVTKKVKSLILREVDKARRDLSKRVITTDNTKLHYMAGKLDGIEETVNFENLVDWEVANED